MDRAPIGWLRERDVDLLICSELHARADLTSLIASKLGVPGAEFIGAWVSVSEADGESDLVVRFRTPDGDILALIENKIAAPFQPDQPGRYMIRATRLKKASDISHVYTMLFAPQDYLDTTNAVFDIRLSYEEVEKTLTASADGRSIFLASVLREGVEAKRRGYVMKPDEVSSGLWQAIWEAALEIAPSLKMREPGLRPGGATFLYFYDALGLSGADRERVDLVYKFLHGFVDLQFKRTAPEELSSRISDLLDDDMAVVRASASSSIRVQVPRLDFGIEPSLQSESIETGLRVADRLREFFALYQETLLRNEADQHS